MSSDRSYTSSSSSSSEIVSNHHQELNESFTPSVCSKKEITGSSKGGNRAFDYQTYVSAHAQNYYESGSHPNKENMPFTNYLSANISHLHAANDKSFS